MDFGASKDHIDNIMRQRRKLSRALESAFEQVLSHVEHDKWTAIESVQWWDWSREIEVPSSSRRMADALGFSITELARWKIEPPSSDFTGVFPIGLQLSFQRGAFCVYLLLKEATVVYIGSSADIRHRLKSHWSKRKSEIDSWQIIECVDRISMLRLEADLIFQHQPTLNVNLRAKRGHFT